MNGATRTRGWPLMSLGIVLGGWILMRAALWQPPIDQLAPLSLASSRDIPQSMSVEMAEPLMAEPAPAQIAPRATNPDWRAQARPAPLVRPDFEQRYEIDTSPRTTVARGGLRHARLLLAQNASLSAGYRHGAQPVSASPYAAAGGPALAPIAYVPEAAERFVSETRQKRWGMDVWALWRNDTTTAVTSGRPSYGRSQAGAVLRYRLSPSSGHAPHAYVRATRALEGEAQTEVAAGLSARPIPNVPVRLAAEARVSETDRGTEARAAVFAVTELPRVTLPGGFEGEAYVQGGYVTGEFATAFADGQARITRPIAGADDFRLTAGAGAWGGAQDDAQRFDVGPTAAASFAVGSARGRISADYRFRVAGDAEPASGPALTLTAGF